MIITLSGVVAEKTMEYVVLEVQGIGYGLFMPVEEMSRLQTGETVKIYTYEHIRENSHELFGFSKPDTKQLFEQLIEVNGVGPRMALNILNIGTADKVRRAIAGGDTKFIQLASGVGKRVAERLVVDLKDKVGLIGVDLESTGMLQSEDKLQEDEAAVALITLGYSPYDAGRALQGIDIELSTEDRVKAALRSRA